jgi:hypothetical protein
VTFSTPLALAAALANGAQHPFRSSSYSYYTVNIHRVVASLADASTSPDVHADDARRASVSHATHSSSSLLGSSGINGDTDGCVKMFEDARLPPFAPGPNPLMTRQQMRRVIIALTMHPIFVF